MTPGALTAAERRDEVHADLFRTVHPPMPDDPDLRFKGDVLRRPAAKKENV